MDSIDLSEVLSGAIVNDIRFSAKDSEGIKRRSIKLVSLKLAIKPRLNPGVHRGWMRMKVSVSTKELVYLILYWEKFSPKVIPK